MGAGHGHWTALDKEFPVKLGQEVRTILPRPDGGGYYRACPQCSTELDLDAGEWVADLPDRAIHGYRISQLFSSKVDPGEILEEYRTTRFPERFFNMKIGIPWTDTRNRVDRTTVLRLCGDEPIWESAPRDTSCTMGVDIGKELHVVISRRVGKKRSVDGRFLI